MNNSDHLKDFEDYRKFVETLKDKQDFITCLSYGEFFRFWKVSNKDFEVWREHIESLTIDLKYITDDYGELYLDIDDLLEKLRNKCKEGMFTKRDYFVLSTFSELRLLIDYLEKVTDKRLPFEYRILMATSEFCRFYPFWNQCQNVFWRFLRAARHVRFDLHESFWTMYSDVISANAQSYISTEEYIHTMFKKVYPTVEKRGISPKNRPDSWLYSEVFGYIPVEIKKGTFNEKALNQLERYMKFYKCDKGYAVGKELSVDLPENITFVSIESLERELEKDIWIYPPGII